MDSCAREPSRRTEQRPRIIFPNFFAFPFFLSSSGWKGEFFSPHLFLPLLGSLSVLGAQTPKQWALPPPYAHTPPPGRTDHLPSRGRVSCSPNYCLGVAESPGRSPLTLHIHSRFLFSLAVSFEFHVKFHILDSFNNALIVFSVPLANLKCNCQELTMMTKNTHR